VRAEAAKQWELDELTVQGASSAIAGDWFLHGRWAQEGQDDLF